MDLRDLDPERVEKAKQVAAGPLGQAYARFACRFAAPILIAPRPRRGVPTVINNATITLVKLNNRQAGVTCHHVLQCYRRRIPEGELQFQVGNVRIDPLERLLWEESALDLAVIDLNRIDPDRIKISDEAGCEFFQPVRWPPLPVSKGDWIAFGGYPGILRRTETDTDLTYDTYSVAMSPVTVSEEDRLISQLEREYWVRSLGPVDAAEVHDFGGMSGGPAFIHRSIYWELVGIMYARSESYDLVYIRPSHLVPLDEIVSSG